MGETAGPQASDVARRIAERRRELGLSVEEVARRAGMEPVYLEYVEQDSRATVSGDALSRLAKALDTTRWSLAGGDIGRPPGRGRAGPHPVVDTLSREQCEGYLGQGGIGRVVFVIARGPAALPVNFRFADGAVVFRTAAMASVTGAFGTTVGFEVDGVDETESEGWSVLVTGRAERVEAKDRARYLRLGIEPWAGGIRDIFVRIPAEEISGRSIRQGR